MMKFFKGFPANRFMVVSIILLGFAIFMGFWAGCTTKKEEAKWSLLNVDATNAMNLAFTFPPAPTTTNPISAPIPAVDFDKRLLEYESLVSQAAKAQSDYLTSQADRHRDFLEFYYRMTLGILAFCGAILTFFLARGLNDAKTVVNQSIENIKNSVEAELQNKVLEAGNLLQTAKKKFEEESAHDRRVVVWICSIISRAYVVLGEEQLLAAESHAENPNEKGRFLESERLEVIQNLKDVQSKYAPTNRTIAIVLGRLHKLARNYQDAINELEEVRKKLKKNDPDYSQDMADFLFNQACYRNLQADLAGVEKEKMKNEAWEYLTASIEFCKPNAKFAQTDPDLATVFNNEKRRKDSI